MRRPILLLTALGLLVALSACTKWADGRANGTTTKMSPSTAASTTTTTITAASNTASSVPDVATTTTQVTITRERAIEIALEAAGFRRDVVLDLEAELDRERSGLYWEVSFETPKYEYSYDIHAETGAVVKEEHERKD